MDMRTNIKSRKFPNLIEIEMAAGELFYYFVS